MTASASEPVRPSGDRRSWWLREALAAETAADPGLAASEAAPPLRGTTTADVAIVGGGYTGLWTAIRIAEQAPGARIVLLEADICGGGPSGRNGGFATGWWDELPTLDRAARDGAGRRGRPGDRRRGRRDRRVVRRERLDAWYRRRGTFSVSAAAPPRTSVADAVAACPAAGAATAYVP